MFHIALMKMLRSYSQKNWSTLHTNLCSSHHWQKNKLSTLVFLEVRLNISTQSVERNIFNCIHFTMKASSSLSLRTEYFNAFIPQSFCFNRTSQKWIQHLSKVGGGLLTLCYWSELWYISQEYLFWLCSATIWHIIQLVGNSNLGGCYVAPCFSTSL